MTDTAINVIPPNKRIMLVASHRFGCSTRYPCLVLRGSMRVNGSRLVGPRRGSCRVGRQAGSIRTVRTLAQTTGQGDHSTATGCEQVCTSTVSSRVARQPAGALAERSGSERIAGGSGGASGPCRPQVFTSGLWRGVGTRKGVPDLG